MPIENTLDQLEQLQLLSRLDEPEPVYQFLHSLTQDGVYQSILRTRRRAIHRRVAECYERLYPDHLDEYAGLLARHYAEAGDDARALVYALRAGDAALRLHAPVEAIVHFDLGLALAAKAPQAHAETHLSRLYLQRGRALELQGRFEHALANYETMQRTGAAMKDPRLKLEALVRQTLLRSTANPLFDPEQAELLADLALTSARALGDSAAEANILWSLLNLDRFTNRNQQALGYGEEALAIVRRLELVEMEAYLLNDLGHVYAWTGNPDQAVNSLREANALWRQLDNRAMLADNLATTSLYLGLYGQMESALGCAGESFAISETIQNTWGQSYSRSATSMLHWHAGEVDQALAAIQESIRFGEESGYLVSPVLMRGYLALVYDDVGAVQQGLETANIGLARAKEHLHVLIPALQAVLGQLLLANGDPDAAASAIAALEASDTDNPFVVDLVLGAKATISLALGELEDALLASKNHCAYLHQHGFRVALPSALLAQAQGLLAAGQVEAAASALHEARDEAESLGLHRVLWRILAALAEVKASQGDYAEAETLRRQAAVAAQFIVDHTADARLRTSFLGRRDVKSLWTPVSAPLDTDGRNTDTSANHSQPPNTNPSRS